MNNKLCQNCNLPNMPEMQFCVNCGAELSQNAADEPAPTMLAGNFEGFSQSGQSFQTPNYQQQNYQQPNFQPNFQPNYQNAPATGGGGQMKKILLGVGGLLVGLVMLASGGVKLYRAFGDSSGSNSTPTISSTPQNLFGNTNSGYSSSSNSNRSTVPVAPAPTTQARQTIGKWSLRETIKGNPQTDGFAGATEENQLKYYDAANNFLHVTMAEFPTESAAQSNLRLQMQKFKNLKLRVSSEEQASDNDGTPVGIYQTMTSANGKLYTIYWTRKNILIRVLGTQKDADDFFAAY